MEVPKQPPRSFSYLLTKWEERGMSDKTSVVWRYSLEDVKNGHKHVFVTIDQLITHLRKEMIEDQADREDVD